MKLTIQNEKSFSILKNTFAIGPSVSGYTLQFSVDGTNWTDAATGTVAANTNIIVANTPEEIYFRLKNNTGSVIIKY